MRDPTASKAEIETAIREIDRLVEISKRVRDEDPKSPYHETTQDLINELRSGRDSLKERIENEGRTAGSGK